MPGHIRETGAGSGLVPTEPWIYNPELRGQEATILRSFGSTREELLARLPLPLDTSRDRRGRVGAIMRTFAEFAATKLRVDVRPTLPDMSRILFYGPEQYAEVRRVLGSQVKNEAFVDVLVGMVVEEKPDEQDTYGNVNHELVHEAATGYAQRTRSGSISIDPQKGLRSVPMLREIVAELTELEQRVFEWPNNPKLRDINNAVPGYLEQILVGQELIQAVADSQKKHYLEVLRPLQRDSLLGGHGSLQTVADVVRFRGMRALRNWRSYDNKDMERVATDRVVDELGLDRAREKLAAFRAGEQVTHMERYRVGRQVKMRMTRNQSVGEPPTAEEGTLDDTPGAFHIQGPASQPETSRSRGADVYFAGDGEEPRRQEPGAGNNPGHQSNGRD